MEKNICTITEQELRQGRQQLADELKQRGIPAKEITRAQLLLEEMFFSLQKRYGGRCRFFHPHNPSPYVGGYGTAPAGQGGGVQSHPGCD